MSKAMMSTTMVPTNKLVSAPIIAEQETDGNSILHQSNFQLFSMLSSKTDLTKIFHSNQGTEGREDPSGWGIQFGHNEQGNAY